MKLIMTFFLSVLLYFTSCSGNRTGSQESGSINDSIAVENEELVEEEEVPDTIEIQKDFLYDKYTLEDEYPYKDTTRVFQWDQIREKLKHVASLQKHPRRWAVLQNKSNKNGEAPLVKEFSRNEYKRVADKYGVEKYQSVPLFKTDDLEAPERYGRDGALVEYLEGNDSSEYVKVGTVNFDGEWMVPSKYVEPIDSMMFTKVIFVDRTNQNIATLENVDSKWLVRSMNKATTGAHRPPFQHETPLGIFVVQEKKNKMFYVVDGTSTIAGFAPYASRFSNGGYIHGIPVNNPKGAIIETSPSLGTTPRSHMCVRNATSHAKFIFDWAPVNQALVIVIE